MAKLSSSHINKHSVFALVICSWLIQQIKGLAGVGSGLSSRVCYSAMSARLKTTSLANLYWHHYCDPRSWDIYQPCGVNTQNTWEDTLPGCWLSIVSRVCVWKCHFQALADIVINTPVHHIHSCSSCLTLCYACGWSCHIYLRHCWCKWSHFTLFASGYVLRQCQGKGPTMLISMQEEEKEEEEEEVEYTVPGFGSRSH